MTHSTINFVDDICDACRFAEIKTSIDWKEREEALLRLLDQYRSNSSRFDCIVPGSGGKDSCYAAHLLKHKYGMNPLTVTWPPILRTKVGLVNFENWKQSGPFENIEAPIDPEIHATLTRLAITNLFHPFQPFIIGQKQFAPRIGMEHGISLIFYGEHEAEYGNALQETTTPLRSPKYYTSVYPQSASLAGFSLDRLKKNFGYSSRDLELYLPLKESKDLPQVHYLGYYISWTPQEAFYYSSKYCNFQANSLRTEGTYSKYNSLDDKIDGLHYYTTWIKFGIGRATYDASQEIRNRHITRAEAVNLVHKFDGEFPNRYFDEIMSHINLDKETFFKVEEAYRSSDLWRNVDGRWQLKYQVQ